MSGTGTPALRERLGDEGMLELVTLMEESGRQWKSDVLPVVTERFGRMLAEESGRLRVAMAEQAAHLDRRLAEYAAHFDRRLAEYAAHFDSRLAEQAAHFDSRLAEHAARGDTRFAELPARFAEQRAELLKWSFLFWIGQVAAMAALLAFMLRGLPR